MNLTSFLIDWRGIAGRRHQQTHKLQRKQQQQQQQIIAAFNRRDTTALKQTNKTIRGRWELFTILAICGIIVLIFVFYNR